MTGFSRTLEDFVVDQEAEFNRDEGLTNDIPQGSYGLSDVGLFEVSGNDSVNEVNNALPLQKPAKRVEISQQRIRFATSDVSIPTTITFNNLNSSFLLQNFLMQIQES